MINYIIYQIINYKYKKFLINNIEWFKIYVTLVIIFNCVNIKFYKRKIKLKFLNLFLIENVFKFYY